MKRILFIMPFTIPVTELIGDNTGNYVYYLAVYSYLFGAKNLKCMGFDEIRKHLDNDPEWIRKNFDIAIIAEANLFAICYKDTALVDNAKFIKSLKIPCYVIGIGCQNNTDNILRNLAPINDEVKNYVDTILESGGMLTLRGNLTRDYLSSLGYDNIPVLGCPSMYINGQHFEISDNKVQQNAFNPIYNAQFVEDLDEKLYEDYPQSVFFDQDRYLRSLFLPLSAKNDECLRNDLFIKLYKQGRIRGDINYYPWQKQIIDNGYNFAYGSRIHGNVIAIQAGIPAFVKVIDSRTREISEFYNIPNSLEYRFDESKDSLYDLYKNISYVRFNESYIEKFNNFRNFMLNISGVQIENNNNFKEFLASKTYPTYEYNYHTTKNAKNLIKYIEDKTNHKNRRVSPMNNKKICADNIAIKKNPKISVIMACYNSADFVVESILSIMNQTYSNWELLCVNDMSTDNTLDILNEYAKKDSRIRVFDKKEKGGRAAPNYNYAIDRAEGDFMCLVDHDDRISPDLFEQEVERYYETGADIIIPDCMFVYPDDPEKNWAIAGILDCWGKSNKKVNRDIILKGRTAVELSLGWRIHGFNLIKSEILKNIKYYEKSMNGDEYSARVFYLNANKIAFSQGTYFYYQNPKSITKKLTPKRFDVYMCPYLLQKLLMENNFPYRLVQDMQYVRVDLYKSLCDLYKNNLSHFTACDRQEICRLLDENKKLFEKTDISKYHKIKRVFEKIWHSVPTKNGKMIKVFGVKIKCRAKKI